MKIFILEDDILCLPIVTWLSDNKHDVIHAKNIEQAVTQLDYENAYKKCDKFIFDASLPAAEVIYTDGSEKNYFKPFNGVDLLLDNMEKWGFGEDTNKVAILTAYEYNLRRYDSYISIKDKLRVISKNSNHFIGEIEKFLKE